MYSQDVASVRRYWTTYGLLALGVLAFAVTLSTRNDWDEAPACASRAAGSSVPCVTEKRGAVVNRGYQPCSTPTAWGMGGCGSLPVDIRFADGSRRHFEFGGDRLDELFSGGKRDPSVVPEPSYGHRGPARVVGRFHGRHLVGLRFPASAASLATDDYPSYGVNSAAFLVMVFSPLAALFTWLISAVRASRKWASQEMGSPLGRSAAAKSIVAEYPVAVIHDSKLVEHRALIAVSVLKRQLAANQRCDQGPELARTGTS